MSTPSLMARFTQEPVTMTGRGRSGPRRPPDPGLRSVTPGRAERSRAQALRTAIAAPGRLRVRLTRTHLGHQTAPQLQPTDTAAGGVRPFIPSGQWHLVARDGYRTHAVTKPSPPRMPAQERMRVPTRAPRRTYSSPQHDPAQLMATPALVKRLDARAAVPPRANPSCPSRSGRTARRRQHSRVRSLRSPAVKGAASRLASKPHPLANFRAVRCARWRCSYATIRPSR
jgi:hypothetical protein